MKLPKRKSKEPPTITVTDAQKFGQFLTQVKGNVIPGSNLASFIKRRLPGEWKTVQSWLKDKRSHDIIWDSVADSTKPIFRKAL